MISLGIEIGEGLARVASSSQGKTRLQANWAHQYDTPAACLVAEDGQLTAGYRPGRRLKKGERLIDSVLRETSSAEYALALLRRLAETAETKISATAEQIVLALPDRLLAVWTPLLQSQAGIFPERLRMLPRSSTTLAAHPECRYNTGIALDLSESGIAGAVLPEGLLPAKIHATDGIGGVDTVWQQFAHRLFHRFLAAQGMEGELTEESWAVLTRLVAQAVNALSVEESTGLAAGNLVLLTGEHLDVDIDITRAQVDEAIRESARDWAGWLHQWLTAERLTPDIVLVSGVLGAGWDCLEREIAQTTGCRVLLAGTQDAAVGASLLAAGVQVTRQLPPPPPAPDRVEDVPAPDAVDMEGEPVVEFGQEVVALPAPLPDPLAVPPHEDAPSTAPAEEPAQPSLASVPEVPEAAPFQETADAEPEAEEPEAAEPPPATPYEGSASEAPAEAPVQASLVPEPDMPETSPAPDVAAIPPPPADEELEEAAPA